jgi:hypothetical protein
VRYKEKKLRRCIPIDEIAGIAPMQNRLLLFMRDHRLLSATLCQPRPCLAKANPRVKPTFKRRA